MAAGLLARTLHNLSRVDLGFRSSGLLVFGITPPASIGSRESAVQFYQSLLVRLRAIGGVESVTLMGNRLGWDGSNTLDAST